MRRKKWIPPSKRAGPAEAAPDNYFRLFRRLVETLLCKADLGGLLAAREDSIRRFGEAIDGMSDEANPPPDGFAEASAAAFTAAGTELALAIALANMAREAGKGRGSR